VPQPAAPLSAHWPSGSSPAGAAAQVPIDPGSAHDWQRPAHAPEQQIPCAQMPELHSGPAAQPAPIDFRPQLMPLQLLDDAQSALPAQLVRQALSAPHT